MERKSISINNRIISYQSGGSGQALILLHGFGEDHHVWEAQATALSRQYQVITPDIPGSGLSELTDDVSMEAIADCLEEIAAAEGLEGITLIGHSMGGYITLAYAEKYPDRLSAFGLFHSSAIADHEEKISNRRKGIDFIRKYGAQQFLDLQPGNLFAPATLSERAPLVDDFKKSYEPFTDTALIEYYEAMIARPDRTAVLENARVPVLFVFGAADTIIPLEVTLEQAALPATSRVEILKDSGHMGMLEEPDLSTRILEDFLADNNSAARSL
ncbi:alpha/beta hydrolase [Niabella terrae]